MLPGTFVSFMCLNNKLSTAFSVGSILSCWNIYCENCTNSETQITNVDTWFMKHSGEQTLDIYLDPVSIVTSDSSDIQQW